MEIRELDRTVLPDGVVRFRFAMPSENFLYTGYILESLEGLCIYTTPEDNPDILQVDVVPDLIKEFMLIITELKNMEI